MGSALWSGWGVRTMSADDAGFNPLSYHNGTVWPHDNSLIAWGLARQGHWQECHQIVRRMLDAAAHFDWQLPEVFAGLDRAETPFPIAYPTAARPAGLGRRHAGAAAPAAARPRPRPRPAPALHGRARAADVGGRAPRLRDPRVRPPLGRGRRGRPGARRGRRGEDRRRRAGVVPGPADRLRRDRVGRLAPRRGPRRGRPRRDAVRVGRVADEGEARVRLRRGAERGDRPHLHRAAPPAPLLLAPGRVRPDQRPHRPDGRSRSAARCGRRSRTRCTARSTAVPGLLYDQVVGRRAERRADLDLAQPAQAEAAT